ncbi:hypothetical protein PR202_ga24613 [Eleusine coracana subsp. coracana]|uniref:Uncharacterized protein n=1 Tax=Eleusine coracana subsp. coracana TaxID=191504 RepID=A0AAV5D968_ELECO|nr:hypothetical protein PR202_ga24613 [Eleusine coracana subsp. coracana]
MEPDAELDASQEGSGGLGPLIAFTNIEGPDAEVHEDDGSPSNYLNLNQEDEENMESEDDDDAEGRNQDNDDAEGQNLDYDDTQTSFQVRCGCGPNKQPSGRYVITEISDVGDPLQPNAAASAWRTTCGTLIPSPPKRRRREKVEGRKDRAAPKDGRSACRSSGSDAPRSDPLATRRDPTLHGWICQPPGYTSCGEGEDGRRGCGQGRGRRRCGRGGGEATGMEWEDGRASVRKESVVVEEGGGVVGEVGCGGWWERWEAAWWERTAAAGWESQERREAVRRGRRWGQLGLFPSFYSGRSRSAPRQPSPGPSCHPATSLLCPSPSCFISNPSPLRRSGHSSIAHFRSLLTHFPRFSLTLLMLRLVTHMHHRVPPTPTAVTYDALICALCRCADLRRALRYLGLMVALVGALSLSTP